MSGNSTAYSIVEPSRATKRIAGVIVVFYAVLTIIPLVWIVLTSVKSPQDSISYPPKVLPWVHFEPTIEGFCNLFTTRSRQTPEYMATLPAPQGVCESQARAKNMVVVSESKYIPRFANSVIIAFGSTALAVFLGTLAAYGLFCITCDALDYIHSLRRDLRKD
jgi:multiple sugar transport system permease protein